MILHDVGVGQQDLDDVFLINLVVQVALKLQRYAFQLCRTCCLSMIFATLRKLDEVGEMVQDEIRVVVVHNYFELVVLKELLDIVNGQHYVLVASN